MKNLSLVDESKDLATKEYVDSSGGIGPTGPQGPAGPTGATGARGGIRYTFSTTTTDADPGTGAIRFNNATIGSVTQIFIDNTDVASVSQTAWYDTWDDSTNTAHEGYLVLQDNATNSTIIFTVTTVTVASGYYKIGVTYVSGSLPADAASISLEFSRTGNVGATGATGPTGATSTVAGPTGATGPASGIPYTFSTLTAASDPGNGVIRFNNSNVAVVNTIYIDNVDANGTSRTNWYDTWDPASSDRTRLIITERNTGLSCIFVVTSIASPGGYYNISVTSVAGTLPSNNASISIVAINDGSLAAGPRYTFSLTTTNADPGNGSIRWNNSTTASVTQIYIDNLDREGATQTAWYNTWDDGSGAIKGYLYLTNAGNGANYIFSISSISAQTGYYVINVAYVSGGNRPSSGGRLGAIFVPISSWADAQPINVQSGTAYSLVASDIGKIVQLTNTTSAVTVTVGTSLMSTGQRVDILQTGTQQVTVAASGTTVNGTPGLKLRAQYSSASILCVGTNDYVVIGDLVA